MTARIVLLVTMTTVSMYMIVTVSVANASTTPGIHITWLAGASRDSVTYNVWVTTNSSRTAPGAMVTFNNCQVDGQQYPLQLAKRTRHMSGETEHLNLNKTGDLQWETVNTVPALGSKSPLQLTLTFKVLQHKGGPKFCIRTGGVTFRYGDRVHTEMRIPLP